MTEKTHVILSKPLPQIIDDLYAAIDRAEKAEAEALAAAAEARSAGIDAAGQAAEIARQAAVSALGEIAKVNEAQTKAINTTIDSVNKLRADCVKEAEAIHNSRKISMDSRANNSPFYRYKTEGK